MSKKINDEKINDENKPLIKTINIYDHQHSINHSIFEGSIAEIKDRLNNLEEKVIESYESYTGKLPSPMIKDSLEIDIMNTGDGIEIDFTFKRYESEAEVLERNLMKMNQEMKNKEDLKRREEEEKALFLKLKKKYETKI